ncbi:hypothetical protein WL74_29285 [Burkholderia cepacia]|uniref:hypothetical protein n=1 Tax=Burkholderia cepacia complex TaxID=87882 RepID=UPI00075D01D6|nr:MULTISPECIES: hypothetical protein [Burkholderia cepacia complex]KVR68973.1 hypothetical protein WK21_19765 [Burkholderia cepacia]KWE18332.1 hypothetical protein WL74_29285 [Burkholderia cepacia]KWK42834.1 hypothetical protein WT80_23900 [Burkholderia stagnalis]KWK48193.1 hypothetical protein WT81_32440 [Burkholderia stagnalis]
MNTTTDALLPADFDDLASFVDDWAISTECDRYAKRLATPLGEIRDFYNAISPRMDEIMRHLGAYPATNLAALPECTLRLYRLALSYFEASHPIELHWSSPNLADSFPAERIIYQSPSTIEN